MHSRMLHEAQGQRTFAVIMEEGDEAMACLQDFAQAESISAAQVTAIGAFSAAKLAFWDVEAKSYLEREFTEQTEVISLLGDIAQDEAGKAALHLHALLGRRDFSTVGGHFLSGRVRPTLEVIVTEAPAHLRRVKDARVGLALIRP
jgi:predicted DNA-binding protein with PD1-like motif